MKSIKTSFLSLIILFLGYSGQSLRAMEKEAESQFVDKDNSEFECCVCFSEINPEQSDNIIVFNCNHYLCNECFEDWQQKGNTCPMCRAPIVRAYRTFKDVLAREELNEARKQIEQLKRERKQEQETMRTIGELHEMQLDQIQQLTLEKVNKEQKFNDERLQIARLQSKIEREQKTRHELNELYEKQLEQIQQLTLDNAEIKLKLERWKSNQEEAKYNWHTEKNEQYKVTEKKEIEFQKPVAVNFVEILYKAIINDSPKEISQAVKAGADINSEIANNSLLLLAVLLNKPKAVKELLKLNAKFNYNYIQRAVELGNRSKIIEILMQYGANKCRYNNNIEKNEKYK